MCIVYLGSGVMAGVFTAGVLTAWQELDAYQHIEAIYGGSAGSINGAYFLTRQCELGSSIYYEDLVKDFILPHNVPFGSLQRYWDRYVKHIPEAKIKNAVNIDLLFDIMENKKVLDVEKLRQQPIPLYAKLLNLDSGEVEYIDVTNAEKPLGVLKACVSLLPYYFSPKVIDGKRYVDGIIKKPLGVRDILEMHPEKKIVLILNHFLDRGWGYSLKNVIEGLVGYPMDKKILRFYLEKQKKREKAIREAMENPRVEIITPPKDKPALGYTTNADKLKETYNQGKIKGEESFELLSV